MIKASHPMEMKEEKKKAKFNIKQVEIGLKVTRDSKLHLNDFYFEKELNHFKLSSFEREKCRVQNEKKKK